MRISEKLNEHHDVKLSNAQIFDLICELATENNEAELKKILETGNYLHLREEDTIYRFTPTEYLSNLGELSAANLLVSLGASQDEIFRGANVSGFIVHEPGTGNLSEDEFKKNMWDPLVDYRQIV